MPKKIEDEQKKVKYGIQAHFNQDDRDRVLKIENRLKNILGVKSRGELLMYAYGNLLQHVSVENAQKKGVVVWNKEELLKGTIYENE